MKNTQAQLQFYQNGTALEVLKRYEFSEDERKLIMDAVRTSKMQHPRMKLIEEADALLKEVAKTRKVIATSEVDIEPQYVAKLEAKAIGSVIQKDSPALALIKKLPILMIIGIFVAITVHNMTKVEDKSLQPVTFEEAKNICLTKGMVLPLTYNDFGDKLYQPTSKNEIGYWTAEKTIATLPGASYEKDDGKQHYVYCVKRNGTKGLEVAY